jgi:hypothetical protein
LASRQNAPSPLRPNVIRHYLCGRPQRSSKPRTNKDIWVLDHRNNIRVVFTDIQMQGSMDGLKTSSCGPQSPAPIKIIVGSEHDVYESSETAGQTAPRRLKSPQLSLGAHFSHSALVSLLALRQRYFVSGTQWVLSLSYLNPGALFRAFFVVSIVR